MATPEHLPISLTRRDQAGLRGDPSFTVVWLDGEHDTSTKIAIGSVIDCVAELDGDVQVDLSGVTFMDASIVGALIGARNRLRQHGVPFGVRAPSPFASWILDLSGAADLVERALVRKVS